MDTASHNITVTQNEAPSLQTDYREEPGTEKRIARKQHKDNARTLSKRQQKNDQPKPGTNFLSYPLHRTLFAPTYNPPQSFFAIILNSKNTKDDYTDLQQNIRHLLQCLFEIINGQTGRVSKPQHPSFGIQ